MSHTHVDLEKDGDMVEIEGEKEFQSSAYVSQGPMVKEPKTKAEKSLLMKSDLIIVPLIALLYVVSYLDRNNLGNARLMGLQKFLHITDDQFYNCSALFFLGYILFMFPGNILIRFIQPQRMIGGGVMAFGVIVMCLSAVENYGGVLALRILIGCCQSLVQTILMYTTYWYKRDEVATRGAIYYSASTLSGAFSGLIAYGVQLNLDGVGGRTNWQWLFLIEGALAVGVGLLAFLFMPPFPDQMKKTHWLFSPEDILLAKERAKSYNTMDAKFEASHIWATFKDPKTYLFALTNIGISLVITSAGIFLPSFINAFGFSPLVSQLFSVILSGCAFVGMLSICYISDYFNRKYIPLICCLSTVLIGYISLLTVTSVPVKVFGACLIIGAAYPSVVLFVTWIGINTGGYTKRAATWSVCEICSNSFAIMGTKVYVDPPRYMQGHSVMVAFTALSMSASTLAYFHMARENKKRDKIEQEYRDRAEMHPHADKSLEEVCDKHIAFRYTL